MAGPTIYVRQERIASFNVEWCYRFDRDAPHGMRGGRHLDVALARIGALPKVQGGATIIIEPEREHG